MLTRWLFHQSHYLSKPSSKCLRACSADRLSSAQGMPNPGCHELSAKHSPRGLNLLGGCQDLCCSFQGPLSPARKKDVTKALVINSLIQGLGACGTQCLNSPTRKVPPQVLLQLELAKQSTICFLHLRHNLCRRQKMAQKS